MHHSASHLNTKVKQWMDFEFSGIKYRYTQPQHMNMILCHGVQLNGYLTYWCACKFKLIFRLLKCPS